MLLMFLSLWGFSISVRYLFSLFYKSSYWLGASVSVLALLGLPPMFQYTSFIYDFPLLLLYTLGLIFLYKQEWKIFLIIFVIGCINKDTTILLTLIFFLYYKGKLSKDIFNKLLAAQLVIFVLIKIVLFILFKNNPGTFVEFQLVDHNLRLVTEYNLTLAASLLGLIVLVFYKWDEKPDFLKISLSALIPLIFLTFFLGYLDKLRDYYEIYSAVIILISHRIAKVLDLEIKIPTQ